MAGFSFGRSRRRGDDLAQPAGLPAPDDDAPATGSQPVVRDLTVGDYANGIPGIRVRQMVRSFFRQMIWAVPLALIGLVAAWFLTADIKRTFMGEGTIMVQLGDEYVYQPVVGSQGQSSLLQTPDTITLNELAIIKNPEVMDRVIEEIASRPGGLMAFSPDTAAKMAQYQEGTTAYQLAYMELRREMDSSFYVSARPKSSIIDLSYENEDPRLAVSTLNALIGAYMSYRRSIFVDGASDLIAERRRDTEMQLRANDRKLAAFLANNTISDFGSEQKGAQDRTEDLRGTLNTVRAETVQAERSLASMEDQLRQTPAQIDLFVDDRASNRIAQAELELKQLLAKYLPTSDPVRQKQLEIRELASLTQSNGGRATGGRRVGPNPVHQDLMRERNRLQAMADSLREKEFTLQRQLDTADAKLRQMTALSPAYSDLLRERETLSTRLKTYLNKEQEALINQQQAEASSENVKVIANATYPIKGPNMRIISFLAASVFWGFTLFLIMLFRVFTDPRLYVSPAPAPIGKMRGANDTDPPRQIDPIPEPLGSYDLPPLHADPAPRYRPAIYSPVAEAAAVPVELSHDPQDGPQEWRPDDPAGQPFSDGYPAQHQAVTGRSRVAYHPGLAQAAAPPIIENSDPRFEEDASNPYLSGYSAAPLRSS